MLGLLACLAGLGCYEVLSFVIRLDLWLGFTAYAVVTEKLVRF